MCQPFKDNDKLYHVLPVFRAAMKMSNIDHCFDNMFTNPKDSQGVSSLCWYVYWIRTTQAHINRWWHKPLLLCRNIWRRTARASFCTSVTSVRGPEAFQSTYCGRGVGMPRDLAWRWKDPVTSNWKISMRRPVSCLSPTMVRARNLHITFRGRTESGYMSQVMNDSVRAWPLCVPGEGGVDGDGDITRPENMTAFRNFVLESTEKRGLHFLMADGVRLFHSFFFFFLLQSIFVANALLQSMQKKIYLK